MIREASYVFFFQEQITVLLVLVPGPEIAQTKLIQCVTPLVNVLPVFSEKVVQNVQQVRIVHQSCLIVLLSN